MDRYLLTVNKIKQNQIQLNYLSVWNMNSCAAILQTNASKIIGVIQELKKGQMSSILQQNILQLFEIKIKKDNIHQKCFLRYSWISLFCCNLWNGAATTYGQAKWVFLVQPSFCSMTVVPHHYRKRTRLFIDISPLVSKARSVLPSQTAAVVNTASPSF